MVGCVQAQVITHQLAYQARGLKRYHKLRHVALRKTPSIGRQRKKRCPVLFVNCVSKAEKKIWYGWLEGACWRVVRSGVLQNFMSRETWCVKASCGAVHPWLDRTHLSRTKPYSEASCCRRPFSASKFSYKRYKALSLALALPMMVNIRSPVSS